MTSTKVRAVGVGVSAAVVAGLLVGVVSRVLMRVTTLLAGGSPHLSWRGSAAIVMIYAVVMLPGAIVAALTTRRGSTLPLVAGAVLLFVPAIGVATEEIGHPADVGAVRLAGAALCAAAVFAMLALLPVVTLRLVRRWVRVPRASWAAV
ncbi:hypothetical protein [Rhodococcus sp. NPDC003348]